MQSKAMSVVLPVSTGQRAVPPSANRTHLMTDVARHLRRQINHRRLPLVPVTATG